MTDRLGVGIIGCGNISTTYLDLAPLFAPLEIRAVADIDPAAARARAASHPVRAESVGDLLRAGDIDIVVNLTVPKAHFEVTRAILAAGKHAYSEKPAVLSTDDGKALCAMAADRGLRIGAAPDTFLGGAHQQARAALDEGRIGRVIGGTCHVLSHGMEDWHPDPDFFFQPGGGPVLDMGPYYLGNLIQLIGPVRAVAAMTGTAFPTRTIANGPRRGETIPVNTPTTIHALLECVNGAVVTLGASWDVWHHRHGHMELYGTEGSLFLPDPNFFGGQVDIGTSGGTPGGVPGSAVTTLPDPDHPLGRPNRTDEDRAVANYRGVGLADMAAAIQAGRPHRCDISLALHAVDIMTGILESGATHRRIEMTTSCERPQPLPPDQARLLLREPAA